MADKKFIHLRIKEGAQRKVRILARALDVDIYSLVDYWADNEWKSALKAGLVTAQMLKTNKSKRSFDAMSARGKR